MLEQKCEYLVFWFVKFDRFQLLRKLTYPFFEFFILLKALLKAWFDLGFFHLERGGLSFKFPYLLLVCSLNASLLGFILGLRVSVFLFQRRYFLLCSRQLLSENAVQRNRLEEIKNPRHIASSSRVSIT